MSGLDTLDETAPRHARPGATARPALVVVWCSEPDRVGELLLLDDEGPRVFGRGAPSSDDPFPRVLLVQQRPGSTKPGRPFELPTVSRNQLRVERDGDMIKVENLGKRPLLASDGSVAPSATLAPGDCVEVRGQLVLACIERPLELPRPRAQLDLGFRFGLTDAFGIVGESPAAWTLRDECMFVANRGAHVLVLGESGTGKEVVAQAIHALSKRHVLPMVARNAATIPAGLADAELFGNLANYPNPGMPDRKGLVGDAHGSTLFLDEIGELPEELQARLLRVLDERGEYQRLGEGRMRRADLRLVAATNRPVASLKHDVAARFKLRLTTPGLEARREDVMLLARHLLVRIAAEDAEIAARYFAVAPTGELEPRIAPALARALFTHTYETHVRELDALLWMAIATSSENVLDLTPRVLEALGPSRRSSLDVPSSRRTPGEVTADEIRAALERANGVQELAWRELGLANRYVLKRLIAKYRIAPGTSGEP